MNKSFTRNSTIYVLNNVCMAAFSFLLLPLYTAYVTTGDYGVLDITTKFTNVATFIVGLSVYSAVVRFYVEFSDNKAKMQKFISTFIIFLLVSNLIFFLFIVVFKQIFMEYFFRNVDFYPTILIMLLGLTFGCLHNFYNEILRGMENAAKYAFVSVFYFLFQLFLNLILVVYLGYGINGLLASMTLTNIFIFAYMIYDLSKNGLISSCFDKNILKDVLSYSIPIIPHNLSTQIANFLNSMIINNNFELSVLGLFSIASKIGDVSDMIQSSINMAMQPWVFKQLKEKFCDYEKNIKAVTCEFVCGVSLLLLVMALFIQELILFFLPQSYWSAWEMIPFIVMTYSIKTIYYIYINVLLFYQKTSRFIFMATIAGSFFNIFLAVFLIPKLGLNGAILSNAVSTVIQLFLVVFIANKFKIIQLPFWTYLKIIGANLLFIRLGLYFSYTNYIYEINVMNFLFKTFIIFLYTFVGYMLLGKTVKRMVAEAKLNVFKRLG